MLSFAMLSKLVSTKKEKSPPCEICGQPPLSVTAVATLRSSLSAMEANASKCLMCSVLSAGVKGYLSRTSFPLTTVVEDMTVLGSRGGSRASAVEIWLMGTTIKISFFCSEKSLWMWHNVPFLPTGNEVPGTTYSNESFIWATQQINHCRDTHQNCNSYSISATLPKRVVFVGTAAEPTLRLYESQGERDPYICLSYCWGQRDFLRTRVDNFESHKTYIEPHHLPPTLSDAISHTRRLGVRYIWIDSLCIIQDSLLDWREEAGKMASIFHNSFLVLSATGSSDAYGGLYASFPSDFTTFALRVDTNTNEVFSCDVSDVQTTTNATETIYVRRALSHAHSGDSNRYANDLPLLPTLRRGWIFQERFLSPRVLHFGPQELYFECREWSSCQCSFMEDYEQMNTWTWFGDDFLSHGFIHQETPKTYYDPSVWREMDHEGIIYVWHRLVSDYTKLHLTFEKDLFPAISGLAREMGTVRAVLHAGAGKAQETGYYAGLWKDSLVRDLCWKVDYDKTILSSEANDDGRHKTWMDRPHEWRAPTWSWGSVNGPVKFLGQRYGRRDFFKPRCEVLNVSCTPAGSDEMGEIIRGKLVLRGKLVPAKVMPFPERFATPFPWQVLSLDLGVRAEHYVHNVTVDDGCQDLLRLLDEVEAGAGGDQPIVYCFFLGLMTSEGYHPVFLLLKRVQGQSEEEMGQHTYRRFGRLLLTPRPLRPGQRLRFGERYEIFELAKEEVVTII
ncbi:heterokaryon incompatibility protein-domain-containing protein [Copromyces sp. CBS 386.78]|nr:heterokaryon incompatibility protein-domain-containing protein [Copromyces sp. CBS 386.78]